MSTLMGRVSVKINGENLQSLPGAKLMRGGVERTAVTSDYEVVGHTNKFVAPALECEIPARATRNWDALFATENASVTFEAEGGKVFILGGAVVSNTLEITGGEDGKVAVNFLAMSCEEVG